MNKPINVLTGTFYILTEISVKKTTNNVSIFNIKALITGWITLCPMFQKLSCVTI